LKIRRLPGSPFATETGPVVLAHRGWSGNYPENTMPAFAGAARLPVDGLEMDIRSTADGVLVVIHDETVNRTTNGAGPVHEFTLPELKGLDAGYRWTPDGGRSFPFRGRGITVPTLAEVFKAFPRLWMNIDIKQKKPPIIYTVARMIRQFHLEDHVCAGSFDTPTIHALRRACPEVATAASPREVLGFLVLHRLFLAFLYRGKKARMLAIPEYVRGRRILNRSFVQAAQQKGLAVYVWTVNERADMERLLEMGVDGLITDYPDRLIEVLEARRKPTGSG
jgi:glycerophosphoryl diester phosphodiesterase